MEFEDFKIPGLHGRALDTTREQAKDAAFKQIDEGKFKKAHKRLARRDKDVNQISGIGRWEEVNKSEEGLRDETLEYIAGKLADFADKPKVYLEALWEWGSQLKEKGFPIPPASEEVRASLVDEAVKAVEKPLEASSRISLSRIAKFGELGVIDAKEVYSSPKVVETARTLFTEGAVKAIEKPFDASSSIMSSRIENMEKLGVITRKEIFSSPVVVDAARRGFANVAKEYKGINLARTREDRRSVLFEYYKKYGVPEEALKEVLREADPNHPLLA